MDTGHPLAGVLEFWDEVMADMEATAEEYREAGWETLALHPGEVTTLPAGPTDEGGFVDDRVGFDVLVPGDEFERVQELVADADFDAYEAYRAEEGDVVFLVVAMKAPDEGLAVVYPLYYRVTEAQPMIEEARQKGLLKSWVRPLDDEERVVFSQEDPEPMLP